MKINKIDDVYNVAMNQKNLIINIEKLISDSHNCTLFTAEDLKHLQHLLDKDIYYTYFEDETFHSVKAYTELQHAVFYAQLILGEDAREANVEGLQESLRAASIDLQSRLQSTHAYLKGFLNDTYLAFPYHYNGDENCA